MSSEKLVATVLGMYIARLLTLILLMSTGSVHAGVVVCNDTENIDHSRSAEWLEISKSLTPIGENEELFAENDNSLDSEELGSVVRINFFSTCTRDLCFRVVTDSLHLPFPTNDTEIEGCHLGIMRPV